MAPLGHVTQAMDQGDKLRIIGQGRAVTDAEWRPYLSITIDVPITDRNRKAFFVGRHFEIAVKPV
ncbi:hypothetical protein [Bradyrhizobium sp.]|uniref:hypothetical protein n=2 Tax=Bradyrhizobium sp. TaxID=376 RepID=UPI0025C23656|nr:hypothetical protein [Bradyrhizobium sp.]